MLGGGLLCHRFGHDVDVVRHLPEGTYNRPQGPPALLSVGAELGFEAAARVPIEAAVELLGPVLVILVSYR